jgi:hypothetical protein
LALQDIAGRLGHRSGFLCSASHRSTR